MHIWLHGVDAVSKVTKTRIEKTPTGVNIYIEVILVYGYNIVSALQGFKKRCIHEIENLTAMNVENVNILAKGIEKPIEQQNNVEGEK